MFIGNTNKLLLRNLATYNEQDVLLFDYIWHCYPFATRLYMINCFRKMLYELQIQDGNYLAVALKLSFTPSNNIFYILYKCPCIISI